MGSRVRIRLMYLLYICKWEMRKTAHPKKFLSVIWIWKWEMKKALTSRNSSSQERMAEVVKRLVNNCATTKYTVRLPTVSQRFPLSKLRILLAENSQYRNMQGRNKNEFENYHNLQKSAWKACFPIRPGTAGIGQNCCAWVL